MITKNLYCILGPSASGKTTVAKKLQELYGLVQVKSYTTRKPRKDGEDDYHYVTPDEFAAMGNMYGYGQYNGAEYGVTKEILDASSVYVIEPAGLAALKRTYGPECKPARKVVSICLNVPLGACAARMRRRGDDDNSIRVRRQVDEKVFENPQLFADFMVDGHNQSVENLASMIYAIIAMQEAKTATEEINKELSSLRRKGSAWSVSAVMLTSKFRHRASWTWKPGEKATFRWACDGLMSEGEFASLSECIASLREYIGIEVQKSFCKIAPNCDVERSFVSAGIDALAASNMFRRTGNRAAIHLWSRCYEPLDIEEIQAGYHYCWNRHTEEKLRVAINAAYSAIEEMDLRNAGLDLQQNSKEGEI